MLPASLLYFQQLGWRHWLLEYPCLSHSILQFLVDLKECKMYKYSEKCTHVFLPSLEKRLSLFPFAIATSWWALSPALKIVLRKLDVLRWNEAPNIYLLIMWFNTSLDSFLGLVISSSSSFIGRFMNAVLVGANTVQGPAINTNNKRS